MTKSLLRYGAGALVAAGLGMGTATYSTAAYTAPADADQIFQRRTATTATFTREEAEVVARRLYLAILDREPDAGGLPGTIEQLQRGQLQQRITQMLQSPEFRTQVANRPPREILEQFYEGLLGRATDPGGVTSFLPRVEKRQYASVLVDIVNSPEFRQQLSTAAGTPSGTPVTTGDAAAAVSCMEQVVEKVRNDLPGAVLLRFESAANKGAAIDMLDGNRRLNYDCTSGVSYSYQDNRNTRSAPAESDFPNESVRACQGAVRAQVGRDRSGVDVTFESAGIMPMSGPDAIRGLGFERPQGANFHYQCEVDGTRVVNSNYRMR